MFPVGSVRRAGLATGLLLAILFSLVLSADKGLHRDFHRHGVVHQDEAQGGSESDPCDSGSCAAGAFDKGLVETALMPDLVGCVLGFIQAHRFPSPEEPFLSLFHFLLPDRGPPCPERSFCA